MQADIDDILVHSSAKIQRVLVLQYSGRNIMPIVKELWDKTNANIELYLADASAAINKHQKARILELRKKFNNELSPLARGPGTLEIFTYRSPASLRVVLLDQRMLYLGTYFYKVMPVGPEPELDTRGGEMPLLAIPSDHEGFAVLTRAIQEMVDNWKANGVATSKPLIRKQNA